MKKTIGGERERERGGGGGKGGLKSGEEGRKTDKNSYQRIIDRW